MRSDCSAVLSRAISSQSLKHLSLALAPAPQGHGSTGRLQVAEFVRESDAEVVIDVEDDDVIMVWHDVARRDVTGGCGPLRKLQVLLTPAIVLILEGESFALALLEVSSGRGRVTSCVDDVITIVVVGDVSNEVILSKIQKEFK